MSITSNFYTNNPSHNLNKIHVNETNSDKTISQQFRITSNSSVEKSWDLSIENVLVRVDEKRKDDRTDIRKYHIINKNDKDIEKIIHTIRVFLTKERIYTAMFPYDNENEIELQNLIRSKNYLIVNSRVVCFSEGLGDPSIKMNDKYFTELPIKIPVRCPRGHFFEQESAQLWKSKYDFCPDYNLSKKHPIGSLIDLVTENVIELVIEDKIDQENYQNISKYLLTGTTDQGIVEIIAKKIALLLDQNPKYCPIFPYQNNIDELEKQITFKKYLIVHKNAICLSEELGDHSLQWNDNYFSGMPIQNPVRCPQLHLFEHESASYWKDKNGDFCPNIKEIHPIGDLKVDIILKNCIEQIQENNKKMIIINNEKMLLHSSNETFNNAIKPLANYIKRYPTATSLGFLKLMGIATTLFHNNPLYRALYAIPLSFIRYRRGEYYKLAAELFSGITPFFSLTDGLGISIITDGLLFNHDANEDEIERMLESNPKTMDLPQMYTFFEIKEDNPTKEVVDSQYRLAVKSLHTDRFRLFQQSKEKGTKLKLFLDDVKFEIYKAHDWEWS